MATGGGDGACRSVAMAAREWRWAAASTRICSKSSTDCRSSSRYLQRAAPSTPARVRAPACDESEGRPAYLRSLASMRMTGRAPMSVHALTHARTHEHSEAHAHVIRLPRTYGHSTHAHAFTDAAQRASSRRHMHTGATTHIATRACV
eukprot:5785043-Pleurochrysis_carterae.AAC.1